MERLSIGGSDPDRERIRDLPNPALEILAAIALARIQHLPGLAGRVLDYSEVRCQFVTDSHLGGFHDGILVQSDVP
jgi:hypothetical protein